MSALWEQEDDNSERPSLVPLIPMELAGGAAVDNDTRHQQKTRTAIISLRTPAIRRWKSLLAASVILTLALTLSGSWFGSDDIGGDDPAEGNAASADAAAKGSTGPVDAYLSRVPDDPNAPQTVLCFEYDYLVCYKDACNITCEDRPPPSYECRGIPPSAFEKCQNESYINFEYDTYIPSEIGLLTNLKSARASSFCMANFPSELWEMTSLEIIDWNDNYVTFDVPTQVGQLTQLKFLNIRSNPATGRLWTEIGKLTNLQHLNTGWTDLTGTIPTEIGLLTKLVELHLGGMGHGGTSGKLTGTIPTEIGLLTSLKGLSLEFTLLSGPLPSEIGQLTALTFLNLFQNHLLDGSIPSQLGNLMNLTRGFNLFRTGLYGSIPSELCSLTFEEDHVPGTGLLILCDVFDCECCVNADVNRNVNYPPCEKKP